jgi:DNA invertase Pin-like site-specific DNA recombinase
MTDKLKVAGYIRVSTQGQAQDGESLSTQMEQIRSFVVGKGWELTKIYEDRGLSGAKDNRPGFQAIIREAKAGQFQGIVFTKLSRFARNTSDFLRYQKELEKKGVRLFSTKDPIDPTTPNGRLMMTLMASISEWDRENIREQMHENKLAKWRDHRAFIGKPPFGYIWNKKAKKLEINEREAGIYREIVSMYLDKGMSMKDVAIALNERGLKAKKKPFSSTVISEILKNPAYYGNYVVNRHVYEDSPTQGAGRKRTKQLKPENEHIPFPIEALVSKTEWDRVQEKTAFNKVKSKRSSYDQRMYWLRDLLYCGECGGRVKPHHGSTRKDGTFPRYYGCYWSQQKPKTLKLANRECKCTLPTIRAEKLEFDVWEILMMHYVGRLGGFSPGRLEGLGELVDQDRYDIALRDTRNLIESLEADRKRLELAKRRILDLLKKPDYNENEFKAELNRNKDDILETESRIQEAQARLKEIEAAKENDKLYREFMEDKKGILRKLAKDLINLEPQDKKRLAESMIVGGKITINKTHPADENPNYTLDFEEHPNITLLKALMDEGKIGKLNQDSPDDPAAPRLPGSHRNHQGLQRSGAARQRPGPHHLPSLSIPPPHHLRCRPDRRRTHSKARRGEPGP